MDAVVTISCSRESSPGFGNGLAQFSGQPSFQVVLLSNPIIFWTPGNVNRAKSLGIRRDCPISLHLLSLIEKLFGTSKVPS